MSLKTAALIALIGMVANFFLSLSTMVASFLGFQFTLGLYLTQGIFKLLIFNGCLILFLAVFYSKQQS